MSSLWAYLKLFPARPCTLSSGYWILDGYWNYGEGFKNSMGQQNKRWKWRLLENNSGASFTQYGGLSFLTNCDYHFKLLDLKNLPTFYHFVLRYWQDYKLLMPGNKIPPEHEIIWNNQNNFGWQKPLFYKSWFHYDIIQVQDLLNVNREFLSLANIKQKFNIDTPFTLYHGLINAFPNEWKLKDHSEFKQTYTNRFSRNFHANNIS